MVLIGSLASLFIIGLLGLCLRRWHVRVELPFGPGLILGFLMMLAFPELINNSLQWLLF
jgi:prepilin signal peptidase PulO-like enzyme (type II secretory pathway)